MAKDFHSCWFLTGATASGKTTVALELAERLGAEIVSMDSMAVYRDLDISTAKPTPQQRSRVPHHLLDVVNPDEEYSLASYLDAARAAVAAIRVGGRKVLFVGGTPLYLKSLLRGLYQGPPPDWEFRRQVAEEVRRVGAAQLHQRLAQVDPLAAHRLHPNDQRRIIRALEVYKITGQPISHQQMHFDDGMPAEQCRVFSLQWPRATLHERINYRVEQMYANGLVKEIERVVQRYPEVSRTASQAVGYQEVRALLDETIDLGESMRRVKVRTRRFAKRQETWFRSLEECRMIECEAYDDAGQLAEVISMAEILDGSA